MGRAWMAMGLTLAVAAPVIGQESREADRGPGVPSSMFGTYIEGGQLLVYPFFEYYRDEDFEYMPEDWALRSPLTSAGATGRTRVSCFSGTGSFALLEGRPHRPRRALGVLPGGPAGADRGPAARR